MSVTFVKLQQNRSVTFVRPQEIAGAPAQCRQDRQQVLRSSTAQDPPAARDLMQSNADNGGYDARSDGKGDGLCGDLC